MIINFYQQRWRFKQILGWVYDYNRWKTYRKLKNKKNLADQILRDRRAHNEKVCRSYGIGKYSQKDNNHGF